MTITLGENRYGKSRVRLMKVRRDGTQHEVFEWNVEVWLTGDFDSCFEDGDNSRILPTDTMKNTVYSLARASSATSMEEFGVELVSHFIESNPYAATAGARIRGTAWKHIEAAGEQFPTAFTHASDKFDTATVTISRAGITVSSGFENLWLLKTAKSAFAGYIKDRLTTLKETHDRLFRNACRGGVAVMGRRVRLTSMHYGNGWKQRWSRPLPDMTASQSSRPCMRWPGRRSKMWERLPMFICRCQTNTATWSISRPSGRTIRTRFLCPRTSLMGRSKHVFIGRRRG